MSILSEMWMEKKNSIVQFMRMLEASGCCSPCWWPRPLQSRIPFGHRFRFDTMPVRIGHTEVFTGCFVVNEIKHVKTELITNAQLSWNFQSGFNSIVPFLRLWSRVCVTGWPGFVHDRLKKNKKEKKNYMNTWNNTGYRISLTTLALFAPGRCDEGVETQHEPAPCSVRRKDFHELVTQEKKKKN